MFPTKTLLSLTLASFVLALVPAAEASPCATPCGTVQVTFDCVNFTVTGEGAGGGLSTQWLLVVEESLWYTTFYRKTEVTGAGPAVVLQHSGVAAYLGGYYEVKGTLKANGQTLDSFAVVCGV